MSDPIHVVRRGNVQTVMLNRPDKRNALTSEMLRRLVEVFVDLRSDTETRVVVLHGAGHSFCSGLDLAEMSKAKESSGAVGLTDIEDVFHALSDVHQPTVAMMRGIAIAGGCELALHCDLRVAARDVDLGMPLARLGLGLPFPLIQKLVETIGMAHTAELLFTGERIDGERALALGMVNHLVPGEELEGFTYELTDGIAANAPLSVQFMKKSVRRAGKIARSVDWRDLQEEAARISRSDDVREGIAAMREKRKPQFRGK